MYSYVTRVSLVCTRMSSVCYLSVVLPWTDYGRQNEWDRLRTEGNKNETWSMKCGLKEIRWDMNNEVDNVRSLSSSWTTLQVGQK